MIYEKIDYLLSKKQINRKQMCIETDIPYSTYSNMCARKSESISMKAIVKISKYFNVTVDYLMRDDIPLEPILYENNKIQELSNQELPKDKKELLNNYDKLNEDGKEEANKRIEELTYIDKYINNLPLSTSKLIEPKINLNQQRFNEIFSDLPNEYKEKVIALLIELSIECSENKIKKSNENKAYMAALGGGVTEISPELAQYIIDNAVVDKYDE